MYLLAMLGGSLEERDKMDQKMLKKVIFHAWPPEANIGIELASNKHE